MNSTTLAQIAEQLDAVCQASHNLDFYRVTFRKRIRDGEKLTDVAIELETPTIALPDTPIAP